MVVVTTTARMILVFCLVQMTALAFAVDAPDRTETSPVTHMVVAANPHASRTGMDMLLAGGSAADAAVAIELVLSLVEPQSSGIGGGAFMLYYDA
ncbi:MAG: gamma-glutamyltransferase, partial [Lysobacterales bacterium]